MAHSIHVKNREPKVSREFSGTLTVKDEQNGLSIDLPLSSVDININNGVPHRDLEGNLIPSGHVTINVDAVIADLRKRICEALGVPATVIAKKEFHNTPAADLNRAAQEWRRIMGQSIWHVTPIPQNHPVPNPGPTPDPYCTATPAAFAGLVPAALTQAEMEALKPGPRPLDGTGSYCQECRLCPPFGYVSDDRNTFLCDSCYRRAAGKK